MRTFACSHHLTTWIVYKKGLQTKPLTTWIVYKKGLDQEHTLFLILYYRVETKKRLQATPSHITATFSRAILTFREVL